MKCYVIPEGYKGVSLLSSHNVDTPLWDGEAPEEVADVHCVGRPWQVLQPDYDTHAGGWQLTADDASTSSSILQTKEKFFRYCDTHGIEFQQ